VVRLTQPADDFNNIMALPFVSGRPIEYDNYLPGSAALGQLLLLGVFLPLNAHGFTWIQDGYESPAQSVWGWAGHMILPWITWPPCPRRCTPGCAVARCWKRSARTTSGRSLGQWTRRAQVPQHGREGKPMSDLQAIADRFEIEALRGEFTDAVMMRDYDRHQSADGLPPQAAGSSR
jgi:hypothetical protein